VSRAIALAASYGIVVRFADLGDWGAAELRSEYDPEVPEIRLNARVARRLPPGELVEFVSLAVGHELYHHRERIGEVGVIGGHEAREGAARDFARRMLDRHT
jgi:hypothetical protein